MPWFRQTVYIFRPTVFSGGIEKKFCPGIPLMLLPLFPLLFGNPDWLPNCPPIVCPDPC